MQEHGELHWQECFPIVVIMYGCDQQFQRKLPAVMQLMNRYSVDMPIVSAVNSVICQSADPEMAVKQLIVRKKRVN